MSFVRAVGRMLDPYRRLVKLLRVSTTVMMQQAHMIEELKAEIARLQKYETLSKGRR